MELEERLCPVKGCDSLGHLNGLYERHFTSEACPTYHRLSIKQCQVIFEEVIIVIEIFFVYLYVFTFRRIYLKG